MFHNPHSQAYTKQLNLKMWSLDIIPHTLNPKLKPQARSPGPYNLTLSSTKLTPELHVSLSFSLSSTCLQESGFYTYYINLLS